MCSRHATRPFDAGSRPTECLLQHLLSELGLAWCSRLRTVPTGTSQSSAICAEEWPRPK
jgi:hypothetical protein